jgi:hypothetical protein
MPLSQEYHISSRTFVQHVKISVFTSLLPIGLAIAYLLYVPGSSPNLMLWVIGASLSILCLLVGGWGLAWETEPGSRWGKWFHSESPYLYPPMLLILRYVLFAFCFVIAWRSAQALGLKTNLWMDASFYTKLVFHPLKRIFVDMLEPSRRKWRVLVTAFVRMINLNATMSLSLSLFSTTNIADAIVSGDNLVLAILVFVPVTLTAVSSLILFLDLVLRYNVHMRITQKE